MSVPINHRHAHRCQPRPMHDHVTPTTTAMSGSNLKIHPRVIIPRLWLLIIQPARKSPAALRSFPIKFPLLSPSIYLPLDRRAGRAPVKGEEKFSQIISHASSLHEAFANSVVPPPCVFRRAASQSLAQRAAMCTCRPARSWPRCRRLREMEGERTPRARMCAPPRSGD